MIDKNKIKKKIELILKDLHPSERIDILESLGKDYRKKNSVRINSIKYNKLDMDRPDLYSLKN